MANLTISPTVVKVLQVIRLGVPVTPTTINTHVGDGDYASKHVWYLRKLGFEFTIQKDKRKVVSYTLIAEPANAESIRNTVHGAARKAAKASAPKTRRSLRQSVTSWSKQSSVRVVPTPSRRKLLLRRSPLLISRPLTLLNSKQSALSSRRRNRCLMLIS